MKQFLKPLMENEEGMGTLEVVIIIAVLIGLAFLLKDFVFDFFKSLTDGIKDETNIKNIMSMVW
ncbi:Flp1 family type IVb pilin [Fusibacter sp. JL298sf-3]